MRKTAAVSNELNQVFFVNVHCRKATELGLQTVSRQKERGERIREVDLEVKSLKL